MIPEREIEEPVTKEFLRAEVSQVRLEIAQESRSLRKEMSDGFASATHWTIGTGIALIGVLIPAMAYLR